MLHLVFGEKGAGKTALLLDRLGKAVDADGDALLLVPRYATFENDRRVLHALGPQRAAKVQVLSFLRLAQLVFRRCGRPQKPVLGAGANTALMVLALQSVKPELRFFSRHADTFAFAQKMLAAVAQFKQCGVLPQDLRTAAAALDDAPLRSKLLDTALIFETYNTMVAQSFFDDQDVLTHTAKKMAESGLFQNETVIVTGFSSFSAQETQVLRQLLLCAKDVYVGLCTDGSQSVDPLSAFALTDGTARQLRRLANACGVPVAAPVVCSAENGFGGYAAPELRHLASHLFDPALPVFKGAAPAISLQQAPSRREECDFAALKIHALLRSGAYRCRDIAVVYHDADAYADEIKFSFQKYGVPVFEDHRAPVANEPLTLLVRALLTLRVQGFSTELLMQYLKTGLSGIATEEIAEAENYALLWDLSGAQWQRTWTGNPDGFGKEMNAARAERLKKLNEIRLRIVTPLLSFREKARDADVKTVMTLVYRFLTETGIDQNLKAYAIALEEAGETSLALAQEQLWDCMMQTLDDVASALGERSVSAKTLLDVFCAVVGAQSLGKLPDGYDQVALCDVTRMVTQKPKVVFVLGVNEGSFPRDPQDGALFSHFELLRMQQTLPVLPHEEERQTLTQRHLVYHALCSAREKLVLSWTLSGAAGEKTAPSPLVTQLRTMFAQNAVESYDRLEVADRCEAKQPAFELLAGRFLETDAQTAALKAWFAADEDYAARMQTLHNAAEKKAFAFSDPQNAKALFGERLRLSASQVETFEECPFKYFCRYGLRAEPRRQAQLDPANSGTVVHYVLEHLLKTYSGEKIAALTKESAKAQIQSLLKTYIDTYMGSTADKPARFLYLYNRLEQTLLTVVERLLTEFANSAFVPVGFEVGIGERGQVKPYTVPLKDGCIELRGVIDRVDRMQKNGKNYIRVVDYKTGGKLFALSDVLGGLSMQMLLYLTALWRDGSGVYTDMTPAGVLYLPAKAQAFDAKRTDDAETREELRMDGGAMEGMLLDDEDVLEGMSLDCSFRFLPVGAKGRDGVLKGNLISLSQLGKLTRHMDRTLAEMGGALHAGRVPATPVRGKTHGQTCEWCDFASVCRREHGDAYRYLPQMTHAESLDALEGED